MLLVAMMALIITPASAVIDMDADGMSDIWERLFETSPGEFTDPDGDPDQDGYNNGAESIAGMDPHDKDDHPKLDLHMTPAGLEATWIEQAGKLKPAVTY